MRASKQRVFNSIKDFIGAMHLKKSAIFRSKDLQAKAVIERTRTQHEEYHIRYEYNSNGQWVAFSDCQSPQLSHILQDFRYQCRVFKIS